MNTFSNISEFLLYRKQLIYFSPKFFLIPVKDGQKLKLMLKLKTKPKANWNAACSPLWLLLTNIKKPAIISLLRQHSVVWKNLLSFCQIGNQVKYCWRYKHTQLGILSITTSPTLAFLSFFFLRIDPRNGSVKKPVLFLVPTPNCEDGYFSIHTLSVNKIKWQCVVIIFLLVGNTRHLERQRQSS